MLSEPMGLRVVANFSNLLEAEVAGSVLQAAGVHAEVLDRHVANALWDRSRALGGIRLVVADEDFNDARAILTESITNAKAARMEEHAERASSAEGTAWRWAAAVLGVFVTPALGWLIVAERRRQVRGPARLGLALIWALVLFGPFLVFCSWFAP